MPRVLNLYAGVGGNRALWPDDAQVTAVEWDPEIAEAYATLWPADTVIIGDAHQYLLEHFKDGWDLIWSSPPCPSHSSLNRLQDASPSDYEYRYPDLEHLYGEILLLGNFCPPGSTWIVENVVPYYEPLVRPTSKIGRHYAWSNAEIPMLPPPPMPTRDRKGDYRRIKPKLSPMEGATTRDLEQAYGLTLPPCADSWGSRKRKQVMRNCVDPKLGLAVWDAVFNRDTAVQGTLLEIGE